MKDYDSIVRSVALQIVNNDEKDNGKISGTLNQPKIIVSHVFKILKREGLIKFAEFNDKMYITDVSPKLKRRLREN